MHFFCMKHMRDDGIKDLVKIDFPVRRVTLKVLHSAR